MRREKGPSFLLCSRSLHRLQASFHFRFCSRIQTRRETELSSVSIKLSDIKVAGVAERRGEIHDFRPVPEEASGRWGGKKKGRDRRLWSTSGGRLKKSGAFLSSCIDFMQKNFGTIFLQLFLCLLLSVVLLAYSYSVINDFRSSLQPDYSTVLNSEMEDKSVRRGMKRLLEQ